MQISTAPRIKIGNSKALVGAQATVSVPIFRITGTILALRLYGVVTVALGANHTNASLRTNDQAAQIALTLVAAGPNLNAAPVGSTILKTALPAVALTYLSAAAGAVNEPTVADQQPLSPFVVVKKTGAATMDIEYTYTTTDNPTTGTIRFFLEYEPLSDDGSVAAL